VLFLRQSISEVSRPNQWVLWQAAALALPLSMAAPAMAQRHDGGYHGGNGRGDE